MTRLISKTRKVVYLILGIVSLGMAYIGVALPGVPGIPFILLAAFFFIRSSPRMYSWLLRQRFFGHVIKNFEEHNTLSWKLKLLVISQLWVSIIVAEIWFVEDYWWRWGIVLCGLSFSILVACLKKFEI